MALTDIGPSAASIDAGLTALRQADTAIRLIAVALVAAAHIRYNALTANAAILALRQTLRAEMKKKIITEINEDVKENTYVSLTR